MSKKHREISILDYYHVIIRGNNKMWIYGKRGDRQRMKDILEEKLFDMPSIELYAYCIMSNHLHMLIRADIDELARFMARITTSFAMSYNERYGQSGHVFQGRYLREAIQSEHSFWAVLRYIHNNPLKAGIVTRYKAYNWSSAKGYLTGEDDLLSPQAWDKYHQTFPDVSKFLDYHRRKDRNLYMDTKADQEIQKLEIAEILLEEKLQEYGYASVDEMLQREKILANTVLYIIETAKITEENLAEKIKLPLSDVVRLVRKAQLARKVGS